MDKETKCLFCGTVATRNTNTRKGLVFYECPVCGRYETNQYGLASWFDLNHLASYLTYNRFSFKDVVEYRYHTILSKEIYDKYQEEFKQGQKSLGHSIHINEDIVENWYPKSFSERVDKVLLYLAAKNKHVGQTISLGYEEALSVLFVDRYEITRDTITDESIKCGDRDGSDCENEAKYMLDCLQKRGLIDYVFVPSDDEVVDITLTPEGYARVDELQKYSAHGRNVLVAMQFGDETLELREALREGITSAGYIAIFIDEVQHNAFITPELLKFIRDSKFVVVDLTHQNNGAYFEEGYAMGLNKPVIQLCRKGQELHFDIAQKNTIMWDTESEIPERLKNRIMATID